MRNILIHSLRFVFLVLLQTLVLHNIDLGDYSPYFNAFLYIMFILMLPYDAPSWLILSLSFLIGLCVDLFLDTIGMHASACVLLAFFRPTIMKMLASRDEYEFRNRPNIYIMGFTWFLYYAFFAALIHHFWFYVIEDFRLIELHIIFLKALGSALFTTVLIIASQYLMYRAKKENG